MNALPPLESARPPVARNEAKAPAVRPVATAGPSSPAMPNPALRLDPGLGLVVLQFRDDRGEIVATLPTERELAAYRDAGKRAASPAVPAAEPAAAMPSTPAAQAISTDESSVKPRSTSDPCAIALSSSLNASYTTSRSRPCRPTVNTPPPA
jgi:hypothetical protein